MEKTKDQSNILHPKYWGSTFQKLDDMPENRCLYRGSGVWYIYDETMMTVLYEQEMEETFSQFIDRVYEAEKGPSVHATLAVSQDGEDPRVWTEKQVKAMMDDVKSIAAENAMKCYTNRIEAMTPPAPVAFHIDNYLWKKHGITL